jgi:Uri superfamily endonuclease
MKVLKQIKFNSGIYILEIFVPKSFPLRILKFKDCEIEPGFYYYVGSAQKYLNARIKRHLQKEKKVHWHIDHITSFRGNEIKNVFVFEEMKKDFECRLVSVIENIYNLKYSIRGFGNSDCSLCESHLLHTKTEIDYSHLCSRYQSMVRFIPSSSVIS